MQSLYNKPIQTRMHTYKPILINLCNNKISARYITSSRRVCIDKIVCIYTQLRGIHALFFNTTHANTYFKYPSKCVCAFVCARLRVLLILCQLFFSILFRRLPLFHFLFSLSYNEEESEKRMPHLLSLSEQQFPCILHSTFSSSSICVYARVCACMCMHVFMRLLFKGRVQLV